MPIPQVLARVSLCWPLMTICGQSVDTLRACKRSNRDFFHLSTRNAYYILSSLVLFYITRGVLRCLLGFLALWGQKFCGGNKAKEMFFSSTLWQEGDQTYVSSHSISRSPMLRLFLANKFRVAVRLFSNRSQMTSKCGKNKEMARETIANFATNAITTEKAFFISKYLNVTRKRVFAHFGKQIKKPSGVIYCLNKMKQSHWLLCVAKIVIGLGKSRHCHAWIERSLFLEWNWKLTA